MFQQSTLLRTRSALPGEFPAGPPARQGDGMISELISNAMHSTPQGLVGVGVIFLYFFVMMGAIVYRIKKGEHMKH
jgi:hypothetical protein